MPKSTFTRAALLLIGVIAVFGALSSSALASEPPTVTVGEPTGTTLTSTNINATIEPHSPNGVLYQVEYGKTKLYGQESELLGLPDNSSGPIPVTIPIFGLEPMATYHYRIKLPQEPESVFTGDFTLETLLDWKVNGERAVSLPHPPEFADTGEGSSVEFKGQVGSKWIRMHCGQSSLISGALGVSITGTTFNKNCKTEINRVVHPECKPAGITLDLTGALSLATPTTINLGSECLAFGESGHITFTYGGFPVGKTAEATAFSEALVGTAYQWRNYVWEMQYNVNSPWTLKGTNTGKKFGVGS